MHSWRVLILPFVDQQALYDQYRFDEPWDGPNNCELATQPAPNIYLCPSHNHRDATSNCPNCHSNYIALTGPGTIINSSKAATIDGITDGLSDTLLIAESIGPAQHWMNPNDASGDTFRSLLARSDDAATNHEGGIHVLTADGAVRFYSLDTDRRVFDSLLTIHGGEEVSEEW